MRLLTKFSTSPNFTNSWYFQSIYCPLIINMVLFLDQICPKWIKLDQMWTSHLSKNVTIKSCHNYHENKHGQLFWINSDQICPKWIKMDQIWISYLSKHVIIKSWHLSWKKHGQLSWIRSEKICPKWIKLDQIWIYHLLKWSHSQTRGPSPGVPVHYSSLSSLSSLPNLSNLSNLSSLSSL